MAIKVLDPIIASRIAAGEVVDRPASVLRELLDNSVDAGAKTVKVYITEGGCRNITVIDDGCGMSEEDLKIACQSHATSKISTLDDLYALRTFGFRGEALCSIAACSKITITSNGKSIVNDNGSQSNVRPGSSEKGTIISVDDIFESIPARKQFLKRPSSEALECKKVLLEKALGSEDVHFTMFVNEKMEINLPAKNKKERVLDILSADSSFIKADAMEMSMEALPVKLYAVCSAPSCYKRDRSQIKIFVNNRVIDCYQLVQAVASSYSVALPGGAFPFFYLFIEDSPTMLDFNIHPTKRECKIRNQSTIYGMITKMIRDYLVAINRKKAEEIREEKNFDFEPSSTPSPTRDFSYHIPESKPHVVSEPVKKLDPSFFETAKQVLGSAKAVPVMEERNYRYIGQAFKTFLIAEQDERLLFIDQHAAHERILYDQIVSSPYRQMLAVPYRFETDRGVDEFLVENSFIYQDFGVELARVEPMVWEMLSIPAASRKNEETIVSYIQKATGDVEEARKGLFSVIACHSAIKSGDEVDYNTAIALIDKVFNLKEMVCPHGRSFVYEISKKKLFEEVGRLV